MSTMTFKVTLTSGQSAENKINIIGTNLIIDYGDGTTTTQDSNTDGINESHRWSCPNGTSSLTWGVTITGNITGLGDQCLMLGSNVYDVILPEGLLSIGNYCLNYVSGEKLIIPSTVTSIGYRFLLDSSVKNVIFLTKNLTTIGTEVLSNNTSLNSVKLPEGLIALSMYSFEECIGLKTLEVPSTLTSFPNLTYSFTNVQLDTLKLNGGPIPNPPINENTKIIVPLNRLQDFINHSSYPNSESRYDYYGTNISSAVYVSGKHMADKLIERGVNASADDGLTTLANKILQIPGIPNHQETVSLRFNDDNNIKGSRPEQVPFKLCTNGEIVTGCLLPMDKTGPAAHIWGYPDGVRYTVEVPDKDQNNNTLTYEWETYQAPKGYVLQKPELNDNTFLFNGLFEHEIRLRIVDRNGVVVDSSDIVSITVKMNQDYNPDGTELTLTKPYFIYDGDYYVATVQGFAYQSFKQLWTNVNIELDLTKYITPVSQSLSVTKQSNGDTIASRDIIVQAVPIDESRTSITFNMASSPEYSQFGIVDGTITLENGFGLPIPNETLKIYDITDTYQLLDTFITDSLGEISFSNEDYVSPEPNNKYLVIYEGNSINDKCEKIIPVSTTIYNPSLDGAESITQILQDGNGSAINYPLTIEDNELVTGCGYLTDGWDNTTRWMLTLEYYTTGDYNGYTVLPQGTSKRDYNGIQQWYSNQLNFYVNGSKPTGYITYATSLNQWVNVRILKDGYYWRVIYNNTLKTTFNLTSYSSTVDTWTKICVGLDKNLSRNTAKIRNIKVEQF